MPTHHRRGALRTVAATSVALAAVALSLTWGTGPASADPDIPQTATVSGLVWNDKNHNGIREDGEPGLQDVTVAAWDHTSTEPPAARANTVRGLKGKKAIGTSDPGAHFAFTDAEGKYEVADIAPGAVDFQVAGWAFVDDKQIFLRFSAQGAGTDRAKDSDVKEYGPRVGTGYYGKVDLTLDAGQRETVDAGAFEDDAEPAPAPHAATITGRVWNDADHDGIQDKGENGVGNAWVLAEEVTDGTPSPAETAKIRRRLQARATGDPAGQHSGWTDLDGNYTIADVTPGTVRLWVSNLGMFDGRLLDMRFSAKGQGDDRAKDSDTEEFALNPDGEGPKYYDGLVKPFTIAPDSTVVLDSGAWPDPLRTPSSTVTVKGRAWNDRNRNGIQDAGEPGIAGLPVLVMSSSSVPDVAAMRKRLSAAQKKAAARALDGDDDPSFRLGKTAADGTYAFGGMDQGDIRVGVGAGPLGSNGEPTIVWTFTKAHVGADRAKDSDVELSGEGAHNAAYASVLGAKPHSTQVVDAGLFKGEPATPSPTPTPGDGGPLPTTGAALTGYLGGGAALIGLGILLTVLARRRRTLA